MPVYELLGGRVRQRVKAYANGWFGGARSPEEYAAKAQEVVARGFETIKWYPFARTPQLVTREGEEYRNTPWPACRPCARPWGPR